MKTRKLVVLIGCICIGGIVLSCTQSAPLEVTAPDVSAGEPDTDGMLRIKWRLQSQENVFGFNVYRGKTKDGPWTLANEEIIPGHDTTATPRVYVFEDKGLDIGEQYYYYIEEITFDGETDQISPAMGGVAKPESYYAAKDKEKE